MGISFKVSKIGTRFRPQPLLTTKASNDGVIQNSKPKNEFTTPEPQSNLVEAVENMAQAPNSSISSEPTAESEASFTLNLFPEGYSIGKPMKNETANQSTNQDFTKLLQPYDRMSESLFLAIESGHLPGDILDNIPSKYVDGALICEVHDFRRCSSGKGYGVSSTDGSPLVYKICLRMSLENVVKDIPFISDNSWTYGDLLEVESRILKALHPHILLDPTPKLDRLCESLVPARLDLIPSLQRKQLKQMPDITVTSSNKIHEEKVCVDGVPERSNSRLSDSGIVAFNAIGQQTQENLEMQNLGTSNSVALRPMSLDPDASISGSSKISHQSKYQMGVRTPRSFQELRSASAANIIGASPAQVIVNMISYAENANSSASLRGKGENHEGQTSPLSNFAKRMKPASAGLDTIQEQQTGSPQNLVANARMLQTGDSQALQMPQGLLSAISMAPSPQQKLDPQSVQKQQQLQLNQHSLIQQQNPHFQKSPIMLRGTNSLSQLNAMGQNSNMQLNNHMVNKPSSLQLLQQQQPKMSLGLLSAVSMAPRPQQLDQQQSEQQQQLQQNLNSLIQQQNPRFQKSPMMLGINSLSQLNAIGQNPNMQLNNHMVNNKPSALQVQLSHQQQQQMQQQMPQGLLSAVSMAPRPQQLDPQQSVQQQQLQQNPESLIQRQNLQFQKSPMMLEGTNSLSQLNESGQNCNIQLNSHMVNNDPSCLQIQLVQQQKQQIQRKMMMGLGTTVSCPRGARLKGGTGVLAPIPSNSDMGNMGDIPMNLSQALSFSNAVRQQLMLGTITPAQAKLLVSEIRMPQNRARMSGAPQSSIAAFSGEARQMHPASASLSMLGQTVNKANISTLQQENGPMVPPKLMAGMNLNMNQQS